MSESTLAIAEFPKASTALSHQLGLEPRVMIDALKSQFFKGKEATDAQLAVVVSIAKELKLNPLLPGQLYPYPDRTGSVVVMIGPDGIFTLLSNNPDIVAQKDGGPAFYTEHGIEGGKETCTAYINHRVLGLLKKTIWVDEWVVSSNPNWQSRRKHQSEIRALKQCARFVIHGIPADSDEHAIAEMQNVTPEPVVTRPVPPPRAPRQPKGVNAIIDNPAAGAPPDPVTEVASTPVAPVAPEPAKPAPEAPKAEPAAAPAPQGQQPRAFLNDGETLVADCDIKAITTTTIRLPDGLVHPTVQAKASGDFNGDVYHFDGATVVTPAVEATAVSPGISAVCTPNKPWAEGQRLRLTLLGYKNKKGEVKATVQKVEEMEGF